MPEYVVSLLFSDEAKKLNGSNSGLAVAISDYSSPLGKTNVTGIVEAKLKSSIFGGMKQGYYKVHVKNNLLHNEKGPAIEGTDNFYLNGQRKFFSFFLEEVGDSLTDEEKLDLVLKYG